VKATLLPQAGEGLRWMLAAGYSAAETCGTGWVSEPAGFSIA
jgi:hypothetical protein